MLGTRDQTIDIAKGMAIIAIVLGHVLRGLASAGLLDSGSVIYGVSDRALYLVHLTIFAFLSGLFLARGVRKEGDAIYLRGRLVNFLYVYLVWQTLQVVVKLGTSSLVNNAPDLISLVEIWKPEGQLWFLPWLMLATTLAVLIKPWRNTVGARLAMVVVGIVSCMAWGYEGSYIGTQGLALLIFFVLGAYVRFDRLSARLMNLRVVDLSVVALCGVVIYATMLVWTPAIPPTVSADWNIGHVGYGFVASLAGLVGVLAISAIVGRFSVGFAWLAFVGKRSLEIFLAHIIAASGTRIALEQMGLDDVLLHIIAGTLCGVIAPILLWMVLSRLGVTVLFQVPAISGKSSARKGGAKHDSSTVHK